MNKKHKLSVQIITGVSVLTSIIIIFFIARNIKATESFIGSFGIFGPFISILLYGILSLTPIPAESLNVINGALFGPFVGSITNWMGNNFAAFIEYYIGRSIGAISNFEENKKKLPFGLSKFPANSIWFLITARFIPGFGSKMVSLAGGVYKVPLLRYAWTTLATNLVGSIGLALIGYGIVRII